MLVQRGARTARHPHSAASFSAAPFSAAPVQRAAARPRKRQSENGFEQVYWFAVCP